MYVYICIYVYIYVYICVYMRMCMRFDVYGYAYAYNQYETFRVSSLWSNNIIYDITVLQVFGQEPSMPSKYPIIEPPFLKHL